jgi:hypothetical protein
MSDQDQVRPYHARHAAPGQEAADVVAEVLKHAAEREKAANVKRAPKGPPRWIMPVTVNLGVLALYFLIASPDFLVVSPNVDARSVEEVSTQTRRGIYFDAIMRIERFRRENGRLPATLEEAGSGLGAQGLRYTFQGDSMYILVMSVGDDQIEFNSAVDNPAEWLGPLNLPG